MSKIIVVVGVNDSMYNTSFKGLIDVCNEGSIDLDLIVYGDEARHGSFNEDGTVDKIRGGIGGTIELYSVLGGIRLAVQEACKHADEEDEEVLIAVITDRGIHYGENIDVVDVEESIRIAEDKLDIKTVIFKLHDTVMREIYPELPLSVDPDSIRYEEDFFEDDGTEEGMDLDEMYEPEEEEDVDFEASPVKGGFFYDTMTVEVVSTCKESVMNLIIERCI